MKNNLIIKNAAFGLFLCTLIFCSCSNNKNKFVKVGLLHSQTGTMASSEIAVLDAELLAIKEINARGGILGYQIKPIEEDGKSNPKVFADKARKLIEEDKVATIFGCWTSDSRKAVKPIVEELYNLLWYPVQYEGFEASPNIMYMGASPNQQVVPAINYCIENIGKRLYLIGSDYIFPRTANKIIKAQLKNLGGTCVGESYVSMHESNFISIIDEIQRLKPDVIINTLNGDSNLYFFTQLTYSGITANDIPVMSFSIAEGEIANIGALKLSGHYVSWNYFESTETAKNKKFVSDYKEQFGTEREIGDPVEAAYIAVNLWAASCERAGTFEVEPVRIAAKGMSFTAPEGIVTIDGSNQHLYKVIRIGKINDDGQIDELYATSAPVRPDPYLSTYAWARGL
ncbi:MAG: urea ABC transporter substrate-binding protein [Treponema sp.]|nr:urea ABC transporter substrate-binding protein [Treponema sp.]